MCLQLDRLEKAAKRDGESSCFRVLLENELIMTSPGGYQKVLVNLPKLQWGISKPCPLSTTHSRRKEKGGGAGKGRDRRDWGAQGRLRPDDQRLWGGGRGAGGVVGWGE